MPPSRPGHRRFARALEFCESDLYRDLEGQFDLIMANPPYIQDDSERLYRHGGGHMGTDLSVRIVSEGLGRLTPGGKLLLYTGSCGAGRLAGAAGPPRGDLRRWSKLCMDV